MRAHPRLPVKRFGMLRFYHILAFSSREAQANGAADSRPECLPPREGLGEPRSPHAAGEKRLPP